MCLYPCFNPWVSPSVEGISKKETETLRALQQVLRGWILRCGLYVSMFLMYGYSIILCYIMMSIRFFLICLYYL